jgi:hypothetical protein
VTRHVLAIVGSVGLEPARSRAFCAGKPTIADEEKDREQPDDCEQDEENKQEAEQGNSPQLLAFPAYD